MAFWSGDRLRHHLGLGELVDKPDTVVVDCNALTLQVGPEIYITPHLEIRDPQSVTKRQISEGEAFTIPAGQFAFLLTEQAIALAHNVMAFISIKSTIKFKGLVNVSGFHVDPGYKGRLVFSVFNAGPAPIHLKRGEPLFLIWVADLDDRAKPDDAKKKGSGNSIPFEMSEIPLKLINAIPGEIHSLQSLSKRIDAVDRQLDLIKTRVVIYLSVGALIVGLLLRGQLAAEFGRLSNAFSSQPAGPTQQVPAAPQTVSPPP